MTNRALNTVLISHVISRFIVGDYHSREPGCVTNMLCKLGLPTLQDWCKQQCLSFFYKVVGGLVPAMPVEQFLKPFPANKRQIRPTKFQDFTAKNILDRQGTLNSRPFLVPHSNTVNNTRTLLFLSAPPLIGTTSVTIKWRLPHLRTSSDGSPPKAPSDLQRHTPLPSHLDLKLGPATYHIKIKHGVCKRNSPQIETSTESARETPHKEASIAYVRETHQREKSAWGL